jgi:hypothetical protein
MYQVLPDLPPEEFEALREDIHRRGVQLPVEVTTQARPQFRILGFFLKTVGRSAVMDVQINRMWVLDRLSQGASGKSRIRMAEAAVR